MTSHAYPMLFSPISINGLLLKNRTVMPPMYTGFATIGGAVTDRLIGYHVARARGGVGLIDVEFTYPQWDGKTFDHTLGIHEDRLVPGLRKLTDAVHREDTKIFIQLAHGGRRGNSEVLGSLPVAPSSIPRLNGELPRELSIAEIEELIHAFIAASRRAKQAGFDGVMVHMAHGYLVHQFLSPLSNKRTDRYGGDFKGRTRFALEILRGIRAEVGKDYPITCRLNGDEYVKGGIDLSESVPFAKLLEANGIDAIDVSASTSESPQIMNAPSYVPMGFLVHLSEAVKKEVRIPVGIVGRIHDPALAETILRQGKADMIALGRALIADPEWPRKASEGRPEDICPCLSCNQGCTDRIYQLVDISCTVNPSVGRESAFPITAAKRKKKVLVIGGGPAGLEAARISAMRGHEVRLYEKSNELGGQLKIAGVPPGKERLEDLRRYLIREIKKLQVEVVHGEVDGKVMKTFSPDVIVMAVGGKPRDLCISPSENRKVFSAWDVLGQKQSIGKKVVIIGGGQVGLETADFLIADGREVIILEMLKKVGIDMSPKARIILLDKLIQHGVEILTQTKVVSADESGIVFERGGLLNRLADVDTIIIAIGAISEEPAIEASKDSGVPVRMVGDCLRPRKAFDAINEGFLTGMEI